MSKHLTETQEVVDGAQVAIEKIAEQLADGWQLWKDVPALAMLFTNAKVSAALDGINKVWDELKGAKPSDFAGLIKYAAGKAEESLQEQGK